MMTEESKWGSMLIHTTYDLLLWFFNMVVHTFFRDIKARSPFNIPKHGPVVFVIAPHHNQFVDPFIVISQVKEYSKRRIAFLVAGKSYRRRYIGSIAKLMGTIPVERAQDLLKPAKGKIFIRNIANEPLIVEGEGTTFTKDCEVKGLVGFTFGNAPIDSIESDTKLTLRKPFNINFQAVKQKGIDVNQLLTKGVSFKTAPHIDNNYVFQNVFDYLNSGNVLGIFPEGGSHDRPDLLPLKPGLAIMALGAAAKSKDPNEEIKIVPVGLNYFHPHRFRSRVVIEFGEPIVVDKALGEKYTQDSKTTVSEVLERVALGLKEVTVTCSDYETLMVVQAARRLYTSTDRKNVPLPMVVEMNRRLVKGYEKYSESPEVIQLKELVHTYNQKLSRYGLQDHQIPTLTRSNRLNTFLKFSERLFKVCLFVGLSLPGVFLFSPVFITARRISKKKAKEALAGSQVKVKGRDVLGTWKIIVALVLAPALYITYSVIGTILIVKLKLLPEAFPITIIFIVCYAWSVLTTYASLRVGEIGVDYYKSLKPLFYSLISYHNDTLLIEELKENRKYLSEKVTAFCDKYGPGMFDDYKNFYNEYNDIQAPEDYMLPVEPEKDKQEKRNELIHRVSTSFDLRDLSEIPIFSIPSPHQSQSGDKVDSDEAEANSSTSDSDESKISSESTGSNNRHYRLRRSIRKRLKPKEST